MVNLVRAKDLFNLNRLSFADQPLFEFVRTKLFYSLLNLATSGKGKIDYSFKFLTFYVSAWARSLSSFDGSFNFGRCEDQFYRSKVAADQDPSENSTGSHKTWSIAHHTFKELRNRVGNVNSDGVSNSLQTSFFSRLFRFFRYCNWSLLWTQQSTVWMDCVGSLGT